MGKQLRQHILYVGFIFLTIGLHAKIIKDPKKNIPSSSAHGLEFLAPENHFAVRLELRYNSFSKKYNSQGQLNPLGNLLNQVNLDNTIFTPLVPFGAGATLGLTNMEMDISSNYAIISMGYGVSSDVTIGIIMPFGKKTTRTNFSVSGGNIGFNPLFNPRQPLNLTNYPFAPIGVGVTPLGTAGIQELLTNPLYGYSYKPLRTFTRSGILDPTIGVIWRAFKNPKSSILLSTGVRIGLAEKPDSDNLLDTPLSNGNTDIRIKAEYYHDLGDDFDFNVQVEHTIQLKDKITKRIPSHGEILALSSSKESLSRKLGNYWTYDIGIGKVFGNWRIGATWHYYQKEVDTYNSTFDTDTSVLSMNTNQSAEQWKADLSWSGIKAWEKGDITLPLIFKLTVQETYTAKNFPKTHNVYLQITSFF
jgi:hypothetical protein